MKKKSLPVMLGVLTLIIGMLGTLGTLKSAPQAHVVSIVPVHTVWSEPTNSIGQSFTVNYTIYNTTNLNTWTVVLGWDSAKLNVTGTAWGDFEALVIGAGGSLALNIAPTIDNVAGNFSAAALQAASGIGGISEPEITLLQVTFEAKDYAFPTVTPINILVVELFDPVPAAITPDAVVNGDFEFSPAANQAPVADFTWSPTNPTANVDLAAFDASASYDPDGIGIANMTFDFGSVDAIPTAAVLTSAPWTVDVNYTVAGTFWVNLTVVDLGKPGFYPPDSTKVAKQILVVPPAAPSGVDVFTIKEWLGNQTLYRERGTGPLAPGSAFAPGETVTLRGYAYYMNIPMMAINVGFQVNDPGTNPYASRASSTDSDGNATVSLRLPIVPKFGSYGVVATCRIFETDMDDTLEFNVGWLVSISVDATAADPTARGAVGDFTVTVTNIDPYDAYPVLLTISVSDLIDVVLGADSLQTWAAVGTAPEVLSVTIPLSAMPGPLAEVEANAYTDWPAVGGTAYCPKATDDFEIS